MKTITEIIKPIELLSGAHHDTGVTGRGCFMNVIAYLNGEPQITDRSPCVCRTVRPIAIRLNDYCSSEERQQLIPFIERAMGSATNDSTEMIRRAWLAADFAREMERIATYAAANAANAAYSAAAANAANAANAADRAADYAANAANAAANAANAAYYVAEYAANAANAAANAANAAYYVAEYAANAANAAYYVAEYAAYYVANAANAVANARREIIAAGIKFLDQALPKVSAPSQEILSRARELVEIGSTK